MIALESLDRISLALNFDGTGSHLFSQRERKRGNFHLDSKTSLFNYFRRKRQNCCILVSWIGALCFQHTNYYRFSLRAHCLLTTASNHLCKCICLIKNQFLSDKEAFNVADWRKIIAKQLHLTMTLLFFHNYD